MSNFSGTQKYTNYEYAPGLATYGVDGKDGKDGSSGVSIFVCQYDITSDGGITEFSKKLLMNYNMNLGTTESIGREYMNGDSFIFPNAYIYKIIDIDGLRSAAAQSQLSTTNYGEYLEHVGTINFQNYSEGFSTVKSRVVLDSENYAGFVINDADLSQNEIESFASPLTIASNSVNTSGKTQFIKLKTIYSNINENELDIYFNSNTEAFHIQSDTPIIIDGNLQVSNTDEDDYDEYSRVITTNNSITSFHGICDNIHYTTEIDTETYEDAVVCNFEFVNYNSLNYVTKNNVMVHCCGVVTKSLEDGVVAKEVKYDYYIDTDINKSTFNITFKINKNNYDENTEWIMSIIGPIEVFIKKL